MIRPALLAGLVALASAAVPATAQPVRVVTDDVGRFWAAADAARAEPDSAARVAIFQTRYIDAGTPGLAAMIARRGYTAADYAHATDAYPEFWTAVRGNTARAETSAAAIRAGVEALRALYPPLRPAAIYVTVGALMTNGMTLDSTVFIGAELAFAGPATPTHEIPGRLGENLRRYFDTDPAATVPFVAVHEVVHTQQHPFGETLLAASVQEGIAEFVASLATGTPSPSPAVAYLRGHTARVLPRFAAEMFSPNLTDWLYNDAANAFGVRDLGYAVGVHIAEQVYAKASDPPAAVRGLIELDARDDASLAALVDAAGVFDRPVASLRAAYDASRPRLVSVAEFENGARTVDPGVSTLTLTFSEPMDDRFRSFEAGPDTSAAVLRIQRLVGWSADRRTLTLAVRLEPGRAYQLALGTQFRAAATGAVLMPTLIDLATRTK